MSEAPHSRYNLRKRNPVDNDVFEELEKFLSEQRNIPRVRKPRTGGGAGKPRRGKGGRKPRKGKGKASQGPSTPESFTTKIHVKFIADIQEESDQQSEEASTESAANVSDWYRSSHSEADLKPGESHSNRHFYYQRTGTPRSDCLFAANVEVVNKVPVDIIVDPKYMPSDDDTEFQRLVDLWQDPAVEDKVELSDWSELEKLVDPKKASDFRQNCYFPLAREDLGTHQGLYFSYYIGKGTFNVPGGQAIGVPLAVCTVRFLLLVSWYLKLNNLQCKPKLGRAGIARSEIPGLLFQANMAFEFESNHEQYPAYVISVRGWKIRFVKGIMTRQEVARLQDKKLSGRIKVQRTGAYDLYYRNERKEFIRVMLGLLRSFKDRREADFSTELL
ncbi:hypothetical protein CBS63078_9142 [Aspergillus niger]|nr:hypothetical protein CBS11350_1774 [Aspergillus niger]KAI2891418.1 hypothetical protein CBS13152_5194 [Aspergillus niger]KAI2893271.1 hypothetical protein CBS63078_9142 [Aspergillus niger]KAI2910402.1 hypothetical protein CBS147371_8979 [Aspergillus niger]KAI2955302.1 hypothetical protein CBS147323_9618 [Aspergillus niger]